MTGAAQAGADPRSEEIAANLARVRERIAVAARAAGRDPGELTLVAVTKTFPVDDMIWEGATAEN